MANPTIVSGRWLLLCATVFGCSPGRPGMPTIAELHGPLKLEWVTSIQDSLHCAPATAGETSSWPQFVPGHAPYYTCTAGDPQFAPPPGADALPAGPGFVSLVMDREGLIVQFERYWRNFGQTPDSVGDFDFNNFRDRMGPPRQCWALDRQVLVWTSPGWGLQAAMQDFQRPSVVFGALGKSGETFSDHLTCDAA